MFCIKCGKENPNDGKFCMSCGAVLFQETTQNTKTVANTQNTALPPPQLLPPSPPPIAQPNVYINTNPGILINAHCPKCGSTELDYSLEVQLEDHSNIKRENWLTCNRCGFRFMEYNSLLKKNRRFIIASFFVGVGGLMVGVGNIGSQFFLGLFGFFVAIACLGGGVIAAGLEYKDIKEHHYDAEYYKKEKEKEK